MVTVPANIGVDIGRTHIDQIVEVAVIVCCVKAVEHEAIYIGFDPFIEWARQRIVVFGLFKIASIDVVLEAGNGYNHGVDRFIDILGVAVGAFFKDLGNRAAWARGCFTGYAEGNLILFRARAIDFIGAATKGYREGYGRQARSKVFLLPDDAGCR